MLNIPILKQDFMINRKTLVVFFTACRRQAF